MVLANSARLGVACERDVIKRIITECQALYRVRCYTSALSPALLQCAQCYSAATLYLKGLCNSWAHTHACRMVPVTWSTKLVYMQRSSCTHPRQRSRACKTR